MKTTTLEAAAPSASQSVEVKKYSFVGYENASAYERRKRAEVVFGSVARNLSDEDLAKYATAGVDMDAEYRKKEAAVLEATNKQSAVMEAVTKSLDVLPTIGAPEGFPETADIEEAVNEVGPVAASLRARFLYAVNWPITAAYGKLFDGAQKHSKKLQALTPEQRDAHVASVGRRSTMATIAAGALYAAYSIATKTNPINLMPTAGGSVNPNQYETSAGNIQIMSSEQLLTVEGGGSGETVDMSAGSGTVRSQVEGESTFDAPERNTPELGAKPEFADFKYNPGNDPMLSRAKEGNDFGPAPAANPLDVKANVEEMIASWKKSPGAVATVMSKLGLVENNQASINQLTEDMKRDSKVFHDNFTALVEKVSTAKNVRVESVNGNYSSYYSVAGAGGLIGYDVDVKGSGHMLVMEVDGIKLNFHEECLYQPSDLLAQEAPVKPVTTVTEYTPQGGPKPTPKPAPERPTTTVVTTPPRTTVTTPPRTTTVTPPPTTTVTPPPTTETTPPPAVKGNAYGDNGSFNPNHQSGDLIEPAEVEEEEVTTPERTVPGGAANDPIIDRPDVRDQGDETGGRDTKADADTQDTSKNGTEGDGKADDTGTASGGDPGSK